MDFYSILLVWQLD